MAKTKSATAQGGGTSVTHLDEVIPQADPETKEPVGLPEPPHILPNYTPGTLTATGAYVAHGQTASVDCPLYTGLNLRVVFNVQVAFGITRDKYVGPGDTPVEQAARRCMAMVAGFENWNFADPLTLEPIPEPNHADWESWRPLVGSTGVLTDLYFWILGPGLIRALNQSLGN